MAEARFVITDSGGVQEETTALNIPCITVRHNTERPVTLTQGTNQLVPPVSAEIAAAVQNLPTDRGEMPPLWDGQAAQRMADVLQNWVAKRSERRGI